MSFFEDIIYVWTCSFKVLVTRYVVIYRLLYLSLFPKIRIIETKNSEKRSRLVYFHYGCVMVLAPTMHYCFSCPFWEVKLVGHVYNELSNRNVDSLYMHVQNSPARWIRKGCIKVSIDSVNNMIIIPANTRVIIKVECCHG